MTNAEYFVAHNRREVGDHEILVRLAKEASKLACAALERCNEGSLAKERKDECALAEAIGRVQAAAAISAERLGLKDKAIVASRDKLSKGMGLGNRPRLEVCKR